jgi:hypothetical protein
MKERRERMEKGARTGGGRMKEALARGHECLGGSAHGWKRGMHAEGEAHTWWGGRTPRRGHTWGGHTPGKGACTPTRGVHT